MAVEHFCSCSCHFARDRIFSVNSFRSFTRVSSLLRFLVSSANVMCTATLSCHVLFLNFFSNEICLNELMVLILSFYFKIHER